MDKKVNYSLYAKEFFILSLIIFFAFSLLTNTEFAKSSYQGLLLFACTILPSLFPYFVITAIASKLNLTKKLANLFSPFSKKIFAVNGNVFFAFLISVISGYPVGAKLIADLKSQNLIDEKQAVRGSYLCSSASPMFLISTVGGVMFNDLLFGLLLFLTQLLSVVILSFVFSFIKRDKIIYQAPFVLTKNDDLFYQSVYNSVLSVLTVGGIIVLFYIFTDVLAYYKILSPIIRLLEKIFHDENVANGICFGIFECTKGLKCVAKAPITLLSLPVCSFIATFSGLSIIMQCVCHLKIAKIKITPFIIFKILGAILSFFIGLSFSFIFLN